MSILLSLKPFARRWRRWILALAGLYAIWILFGFLVLPGILRTRMERGASEALHRKVTLQRVRFNPILVTATLEGLRIPNRDGGDWITLRRLYVTTRLYRLVARTVALGVVDLDGLTVRTDLDPKGRLNFQDLLEADAKAGPEQPSPPSSWIVAIGRFQLRDSRLDFVDRSMGAPFRTSLGPVNLRVDGIRTQLGHRSGYALEAWTEAREHLAWKGDFSLQPLSSRGSLLVENVSLPKYRPYEQEEMATEVRSGTASLKAKYQFEWAPGRHRFEVSELGLAIRDLKLAERGEPEAAVDLPALDLQDGRLDLLESRLDLGSLSAQGGILRVKKAKDGSLNLARMFTRKNPKPKDPNEKPFRLAVREVALTGFRLGWEDQAPARPVAAEAEAVDLHWQGFSLDPAARSKVSLALRLGAGSLRLEGDLAPLQVAGDLALKAEGLALAPWDPYLDTFLDARLTRGQLALEGRLKFTFTGARGDGLTYQGGAGIQGLEVQDAALNEPFLRWKQLRLSGMEVRTQPVSCAIKRVEWTDPEGRLVVGADGTTNVARALKLGTEAKPTGVVASALPPTPEAAPDVAIAQFGITGGRLSLIDRSLQPNAALLLSDLEGSYLGLSSKPDATSEVSFKGKAGGLAPITIQGHAMPLRKDLDTDVTLKIQGADLTDFSPYTGKYLGYTVQKGKLDLEARLRIDHRKLDAKNAVKLNQFYLGEKVQSPEATGLPVKLGLALLRDRRGVIAFDLPIEGSLDDPDIKYGKLVWKAILGLLGRIATSPFTLIGNLFGSDAGDLSSVTYSPGADVLDAAGTAKLQTLVKALADRPELRLEAEGAADPAQDGAALRRQAFEALLRRTRMKGLGLPEEPPLPPAERERWVRAAFEAAFPPAPVSKDAKAAPAAPPPPPAELEQRLLDTVAVGPAELAQLADRRVKGVLAWLLEVGKADPERVYQVREGKAQGPVVGFSLK